MCSDLICSSRDCTGIPSMIYPPKPCSEMPCNYRQASGGYRGDARIRDRHGSWPAGLRACNPWVQPHRKRAAGTQPARTAASCASEQAGTMLSRRCSSYTPGLRVCAGTGHSPFKVPPCCNGAAHRKSSPSDWAVSARM